MWRGRVGDWLVRYGLGAKVLENGVGSCTSRPKLSRAREGLRTLLPSCACYQPETWFPMEAAAQFPCIRRRRLVSEPESASSQS